MLLALSVIAAGGGVNWVLLIIAGVILVAGSLIIGVYLRTERRRQEVEALRSHRDTAAPHMRASNTIPADGHVDSARRGYDEAVQVGDHVRAALYAQKMRDPRLYAQALERSGDIERAVAAWVEVKEYDRAAKLLVQAGQPAKAGHLYAQFGSKRKAIDCFLAGDKPGDAARILRQTGDEQRANYLDGEAQADKGEHMVAARFFIAAKDMMKAAEQLIAAGDMPKAVEALRRGGKADEAAGLFVDRGEYLPAAKLYEEAGRHSEAADCYEKLGNMAAHAKSLAAAGDGYKAGRVAFERGDFDEGLGYFEALGPLDARYADAGLFRGQIYERRGQLQEAADAYTTFLKDRDTDEKNKVLFLRVAQIQEGTGRLRQALNILGRIITSGLGTPDVTAWAARLERATMEDVATRGLESKQATGLKSTPKRRGGRGLQGSTQAGMGGGRSGRSSGSTPKPSGGSNLPPEVIGRVELGGDPPAVQRLERRYKFKGKVGQGGNGVVYRAKDRALGREVVVKFLHQALLPTEVARKYFQREAKTAASLNHPNIVTIFDIGQEEETLYFSMELVEGATLADMIVENGGTLPHKTILPLVQELGLALDYAHDRQVIHRDIKPGNIMVNKLGHVKLLDFGLAKALDENPDKSVFLCGTPFYMSPEQIRRDFLDHRTDIYSLGCLLYVMYTGDVPFPEGNVFYQHQHSTPPNPADLVPNMPPGVAEVLLKSVAKDRAARYQRASDVADALTACG